MSNLQTALDERLRDKWWRLTHLYKILNKEGQLVTFRPNLTQLKYLAARGAHARNLIIKYRQGGFTTLHCIDALDEALWVPGSSNGIIAHEREALIKIFGIVKRAYQNLPEEIKPKAKTDTKNTYEFTHRFDGLPLDSTIYVALKLRSGTTRNVHITESAYIKNRQELKAGSKQAVPITGRISEETTGNGFDDFYEEFMEAYNDPNPGPYDYKAYFFAWFEDPQYQLPGAVEDGYTKEEEELKQVALETKGVVITDGQILWRRWKMKELRAASDGIGLTGDQLFKQEYPATVLEAFQSGSGNVFDLDRLSRTTPKVPLTLLEIGDVLSGDPEQYEKAKHLYGLGVRFWHLPTPGKEYVMGVDPSDGEGADSSGVDVWTDEGEKIVQCAQFYGKLRPDELAELTKDIAEFYNKALVGVENNMLSTVLFLSKIYDNYYYSRVIDERTDKRTKKIGWNTNTKTRDVMIDDFMIAFDEGVLEINSAITLKEMGTFVKKENGKREHADGKHDDALFGGFISLQMRKYNKPTVRAFAEKPF